MPSHIFTRVGAWADSVATNRRSADAAMKDNVGFEAFHAADYMVYANLQLGREQEARRVLDELMRYGNVMPEIFIGPYAAASMPARIALERNDWAKAAKLETQESRFAFVNAITTFSRALGAARQADVATAERGAQQLEAQHKALVEAKNSYWATEVEVQRTALAAWIAQAKGQNDEGLRLMRAAADLEDRNDKHIVTPGRVLPARELLGDMLLELKQPAAALKEFELSHTREPNRLRGIAGAAAAAEASGERDKARRYHAALVELTRDADSLLPRGDSRQDLPGIELMLLRRRAMLVGGALALLLPAQAGAVDSADGADEALKDDADFAAGMSALRGGDAAAALPRLQAALRRFPDAAELHNELGFAHRKLRRMDKAFEHYKRALAIDPRHRGAHEYIGEAYLMVGDVVSAEKHLAALAEICLLPCDEQRELAQAIAAHRAAAPVR